MGFQHNIGLKLEYNENENSVFIFSSSDILLDRITYKKNSKFLLSFFISILWGFKKLINFPRLYDCFCVFRFRMIPMPLCTSKVTS